MKYTVTLHHATERLISPPTHHTSINLALTAASNLLSSASPLHWTVTAKGTLTSATDRHLYYCTITYPTP